MTMNNIDKQTDTIRFRLARKITIWILIISSFFTILSSIFQLYIDYQTGITGIEKILTMIETSHIDSLNNAIWNMDDVGIKTHLDGLLNLPDISYVHLKIQQINDIVRGNMPERRYHLKRSYLLQFYHEDLKKTIKIGELTVIASLEHLYRILKDKILIILITKAIKTFFVSFFIIFLIYSMITKHLARIGKYLTKIELTNLPGNLTINKGRFFRFSGKDELDLLVSKINSMQIALKTSIIDLKKANIHLETEIEERKKAESALSKEKERLLITLRSIGDGVITTDTKSRVTLMNKVAENLTGWTQTEAKGKHISDVFHIINENTKQPSENPVEKVLKTKQIVELENHTNLIRRDGTKRMITDSGSPIFDSNSELIGVILVFRDITEKYQIEQQLQQSQKMKAIATLAGGIAHDFNNMLGVITGNVSYALSISKTDEEIHDVLSDIHESSRQAHDLTNQLLTFSKGGAPIKKTSDINKIIKSSAIFSSRGAQASCHFELSNDLWMSEVDEGQINQVIGNLVINANQAMPGGGTITIRTENVNLDADINLPLPNGKFIKIIIEDQGVGITKKHLPNIFEPYFTTKQKGSGLGLATTYSIVKKHDGHISVDSEIDKGTVFNIYLPAALQQTQTVIHQKSIHHFGQGKILIMDDQGSILKMVSRMLNRMGYVTEAAVDGIEAIEMYRKAYEANESFDLVILDLTVPGGMGGEKTIVELLKIDSNVKALVSSGYSISNIMANFEDYGFCGVVPKPYTKMQLAEVLNNVFGQDGDKES